MEHLDIRVIGHFFKLLTKIVNFYAKFREKICRRFEESDFSLEKYQVN
jgi:hypothetical protein